MHSSETLVDPVFAPRGGWPLAGLLLAVYWGAVLWIFRDTALAIEGIWSRSDTFAHGYLILPIALWLVYRLRGDLARLSPRGSPAGALMAIPPLLAWLVASLVEVQVVQQLALVAVLLAGTWAILGTPVARLLAFPLGFCFLAVPMGEGLIPPMQAFTADVTVRLVELSGVPVYREGMQISLPSGNWRVVEACSGVRYLIASVTLGVLYAYLSYRQWWRRLLFVALSIALPIVANALRAYMIVMLGHLSNGRLAAGVDHLIYGWVFFGVVMLLMFWLGSLWAEDSQAAGTAAPLPVDRGRRTPGVVAGFAVSLLLAASVPQSLRSLESNLDTGQNPGTELALPPAQAPWSRAPDPAPAVLSRQGADRVVDGAYRRPGQSLHLAVLQFPPRQRQGAEAVVDYRRLFENDIGPDLVGTSEQRVKVAGQTLNVTEILLRRGGDRLRVWYWYRVGEHSTGSGYLAKVHEILQRLAGDAGGSRRLVLMAPEGAGDSARPAMAGFLTAHWAALAGGD